MTPADVEQLANNLAGVRGRIATAASAAGRNPTDVRLVAVAKYVDAEAIRALYELGCRDFGESRPQSLWSKAEQLSDLADLRWHMIGHLQRNKAARTIPLVDFLHSGDSERLLAASDAAATRPLPATLEVNISGDAAKGGFTPDAVREFVGNMPRYEHLEIVGLMAMAAREGGVDQAREDFAALRRLRDELRSIASPEVGFEQLSMGMSGDFEAAVAEGATMVRVGSILFEGIS